MPFTILKIGSNKPSANHTIPMLLFLHGAGERGNDNMTQLKVGLPTLINSILESRNACYIIIPQCPKDEKWVPTDWSKKYSSMDLCMSWPLASANELLDSIMKANKEIDSNRIYVTGYSMGGFGCWEMLQRFPSKFAAAIPICGGGDTLYAKSLIEIPIWAFHSKNDKLVPLNRTTDMGEIIAHYGNNFTMTIMENEGHFCWDKVYEDHAVVKWLFSKKRNDK